MARERFAAGIEDLIILPLVLAGVAVSRLFRTTFSMLVTFLDYAFPILLQLMRFPLFTIRLIGDGGVAFLTGVVGHLPVPASRRDEWRERVSRQWSQVRQKISYKGFEEALHRAFERGMAWVFRKCKRLTPGGALLVIAGAVLWLPVSIGVATGMHAFLVAKAASLPAWMQLLHPLATILAKSKLLVLPVYPAAWPQAKKHPFVRSILQSYRYFATLYLMQKTGCRYREMKQVAAQAAEALQRAAFVVGLGQLSNGLRAAVTGSAAWIGRQSRAAIIRTAAALTRLPLIGSVVSGYAAQYAAVDRQDAARVSEKLTSLYQRWSIKLSAEYYEAKEAEAAKGHG